VDRIARDIQSVRLDVDIDYRDTLAYILFDGLSASESFFMEALDSGRFPCLFVGGPPVASSTSRIRGFTMAADAWKTMP
jgi:hypothetical protein